MFATFLPKHPLQYHTTLCAERATQNCRLPLNENQMVHPSVTSSSRRVSILRALSDNTPFYSPSTLLSVLLGVWQTNISFDGVASCPPCSLIIRTQTHESGASIRRQNCLKFRKPSDGLNHARKELTARALVASCACAASISMSLCRLHAYFWTSGVGWRWDYNRTRCGRRYPLVHSLRLPSSLSLSFTLHFRANLNCGRVIC